MMQLAITIDDRLMYGHSGKTVGTRGETLVNVVISEDRSMLSAYPENTKT